MKILALCSIKTQLWCFLKTKNFQKFLTWIWLNIFQLIMFKTWKKTQKRSKKNPQMKLPVHFTVLHIQRFSAISSNLVKIALFKGSFAPGNLEMTNYTWIYIKSGQKNPILTCNTFVDTFLPRALLTENITYKFKIALCYALLKFRRVTGPSSHILQYRLSSGNLL